MVVQGEAVAAVPTELQPATSLPEKDCWYCLR